MEEKTANMAENIRVTFTGFHYIKDGDYPNDFEVCLADPERQQLISRLLGYRIICHGRRQAADGAFRQGKGCFIDAGLSKSLDEAGG